jgi:DNA-binding IclR family transcriptional regulator
VVLPDLQQIATTFRAAAGLTTRERLSMLCLQRFEGQNATLTVSLRVGSTVPIANSGVGWAYLSGLAPAQRDSLVAEIRNHDPDMWRTVEKHYDRAMKEFAKSGYVIDADVIYIPV